MKILHSSDWHLGRQFHNVSLLEDQAHVLNQLLSIAQQQQVDVVIIAGDVFDRAVPPSAAVSLLDNILNRLCMELSIPVIMISGNHDSPERLGFGSRQLSSAGLHIIGPLKEQWEPIVIADEYGEVAFYGIPYVDPATIRDCFKVDVTSHDQGLAFLCQQIEANNDLADKRRTVVISHCFLEGGDESESERPLSVGGADRVSPQHFLPFNYTALGHLHGPQFKGAEYIRYSGSPLKYSFSEEYQKKSLTILDLDEQGNCHIEKFPLVPLRNMRSIEGPLQEILEQGKIDPNADDYLLVRLTDSHAIFDIMGKLREVYPNVLHLERPGLHHDVDSIVSHREHLKRSEQAMFNDFYLQVKGHPLSEPQEDLLNNIIDQLRSENS